MKMQPFERTPWALFNGDTAPTIQRVDELSSELSTDNDAALTFLEDLEKGDSKAIDVALAICKFYGAE